MNFSQKLIRLRMSDTKNDTWYQAFRALEPPICSWWDIICHLNKPPRLADLFVSHEFKDLRVGTQADFLARLAQRNDVLGTSAAQDEMLEKLTSLDIYVDAHYNRLTA